MDQTRILPPRKVETTIMARCVHCGRTLYAETVTEERAEGEADLREVGREIDGPDPARLVCGCREEDGDGSGQSIG